MMKDGLRSSEARSVQSVVEIDVYATVELTAGAVNEGKEN
jgi:hypothetical protein